MYLTHLSSGTGRVSTFEAAVTKDSLLTNCNDCFFFLRYPSKSGTGYRFEFRGFFSVTQGKYWDSTRYEALLSSGLLLSFHHPYLC